MKRAALVALCLAIGGCDDAQEPAGETPDVAVDAAIDEPMDAAVDAAVDAEPDPEPDAAPLGPPSPPEGTATRLAGGSASGFVDGVGAAARFNGVTCIALSPDGDTLYASDTFNGLVRAVDLDSAEVSTLAGRPLELATFDGAVDQARFSGPRGCAATADAVYVADGPALRRIDLAEGTVSTVAGQADSRGNEDGVGTDARLGYLIHDIEPAADGNGLYLADRSNDSIRLFESDTGQVTTVVAGGLNGPGGIARVDDVLYVADTFDGELVRVDLTDYSTEVVASGFDAPQGLAVDRNTAWLGGFDGALYQVDLATGDAELVLGVPGDTRPVNGEQDEARLGGTFAAPVVDDVRKQLYYVDLSSGGLRQIDTGFLSVGPLAGPDMPAGFRDGPDPLFETLYDVVADGEGWLVADPLNSAVRRIAADGSAETLFGVPGEAEAVDGPTSEARIVSPVGLAADGERVYVADYDGDAVRLVVDGQVSTLADAEGAAGLDGPWGMGLAPDGRLYVTEADRGSVRVIEPDGTLGVAAPPGRFDTPLDVAVDPRDGAVYVADAVRSVIYRLDDDGLATAVVGQPGQTGVRDGALDEALLAGPTGLTFAPDGGLLVVDGENHLIRRVDFEAGVIERWLGHPTRHGGQAAGTALPWSEATLERPQAVATGADGALGVVSEFGLTVAVPAP